MPVRQLRQRMVHACGAPPPAASASRSTRLLWCRRLELVELTSRLRLPRFTTSQGLPPDALCPSLNFELMAGLLLRVNSAAGWARVFPFTRTTATSVSASFKGGTVTLPTPRRCEFGKFRQSALRCSTVELGHPHRTSSNATASPGPGKKQIR